MRTQWQANNHFSKGAILAVVLWRGTRPVPGHHPRIEAASFITKAQPAKSPVTETPSSKKSLVLWDTKAGTLPSFPGLQPMHTFVLGPHGGG